MRHLPQLTYQIAPGCLLLALGLAACASPPQAPPGKLLGYGTPGVESYMPPEHGGELNALLARCRDVAVSPSPPPPQTLAAACDQLHRTMRNQPGNAE